MRPTTTVGRGLPIGQTSTWPFLFFLAALVLHSTQLLAWLPSSDELGYGAAAQELLRTGTLTSTNIMFYPPLFIYLSGAVQAIGIEPLASVRAISALFGAMIVPVLYYVLKRNYSPGVAWLAGLCLVFWSPLNAYSRLGQVETIHLFFSLVSMWLLLEWSSWGRWARFLSGLSLAMALWAKEVALMFGLATIIYLGTKRVYLEHRGGLREYLDWFAGLACGLVPLILLGLVSGSSLFFEVSTERSYDVNMLALSPVTNLKFVFVNILRMLGIDRDLYYIVGVPLVAVAVLLLLRAAHRRVDFALFVLSYLVVAVPFFLWFSRKFEYYMLPTSLFLFLVALCEVGQSIRQGLANATPPPRQWMAGVVAAASLLFVSLVVNVVGNLALYASPGPQEPMRRVLFQFARGARVLSSHPSISEYVRAKEGLPLTIGALFSAPGYVLNWAELSRSDTAGVVIRRNYFLLLRERDPRAWSEVEEMFPVREDFADVTVLTRRHP